MNSQLFCCSYGGSYHAFVVASGKGIDRIDSVAYAICGKGRHKKQSPS